MSDHCQHCDSFIDQVRAQCQRRGARLTPTREHVLRLLVDQQKPVKAYDLLALFKHDQAGAAPPTIYRALEFLVVQGFVHKLESINAFVSCGHLDATHQGQFLICDHCETAVELDDASLSARIQQAAKKRGFHPERQTIEVHGLCRSCADSR